MTYPAIGLMYIFSLYSPNPTAPPLIIFVSAPLTIAIVVYLIVVFTCVVYNVFSKLVGGIKIEVEDSEQA
jgi:hypothetical protein